MSFTNDLEALSNENLVTLLHQVTAMIAHRLGQSTDNQLSSSYFDKKTDIIPRENENYVDDGLLYQTIIKELDEVDLSFSTNWPEETNLPTEDHLPTEDNNNGKNSIAFAMDNQIKWILADNLVSNKIDFKLMENEYGIEYTQVLLKTLIGNEESRWYYQFKGVLDDIVNYLRKSSKGKQ